MAADLVVFRQQLQGCRRCRLAETRQQPVCDSGPLPCPVFLLGEAPGGDEDRSGLPFTGQAGKELDSFLLTIGLDRQQLYIGNTVKCRPVRPSSRGRYGNFANRPPSTSEIKACAGWLEEEINLVQPRVVVTLGGVPLARVLGRPEKIGDWHGRPFHSGIIHRPVFPLYHPAAVIYDRSKKASYLEDLQALRIWLAQEGILESAE